MIKTLKAEQLDGRAYRNLAEFSEGMGNLSIRCWEQDEGLPPFAPGLIVRMSFRLVIPHPFLRSHRGAPLHVFDPRFPRFLTPDSSRFPGGLHSLRRVRWEHDHATASSPFFSTSDNSLSEAPEGRFSPRSHLLTKLLVTFR